MAKPAICLAGPGMEIEEQGAARRQWEDTPPNPFSPGTGEPPPCLAGREALQDRFRGQLNQLRHNKPKRHFILHGPRGMGKTVLLHWLKAESEKWGMEALRVTPSNDLESAKDIPRLLMPPAWYARWLPKAVSVGAEALAKTTLRVQFQDESGNDRDGSIVDHIAASCLKKPRILLIDEAHTISDPKIYQKLFNLTQDVAQAAPFMLVLAGTPGLAQVVRDPEIKATFFPDRAKKEGIGQLSDEDAMVAVRDPLKEQGFDISRQDLERIVSESQGYPQFLQVWGAGLWDALMADKGQKKIGPGHMVQAEAAFSEERAALYKERYDALAADPVLLRAAYAVGEGFAGEDSQDMGTVEIDDRIMSILDQALSPDEKHAMARRLRLRLYSEDYVWEPPSEEPRPGIPSLMSHLGAKHRQQWTIPPRVPRDKGLGR